ncbi:MAG: endonuclease Q family protein [Candidatus Aenigmatarchaeota archaeon]
MIIIFDAHIHSYLSRATSKQMNLEGLSKGAKLKGLNMLGTGDIFNPIWFKELKQKLQPVDESGLFQYKEILWMLTGEVNTVYQQNNKTRKVHHLLHIPSFEIAEQIIEKLSRYGNLKADGRPTLQGLTSPELVEILIGISKDIMITPAHLWTSWFGALGEFSGFNSVEECYQDQTKHIFSLETGLSSDPAMNWRISSLDKFALVSNSDSHSPWCWRLGREANCFNLEKLTYWEIVDAIKKKDKKKFLYTIEVDPNYGKYHWDGHRNCEINLHPRDAMKLNNICPKCGKKLTIGVLHRVEELADRPEGFVPKDAIPFKTLLPLYEIISFAWGCGELYSKKVLQEHNKLIEKFINELNVLLNVPKEELLKVTNEKIADAIIRVREGRVSYKPGADGQYGKVIFNEKFIQERTELPNQKSLKDF